MTEDDRLDELCRQTLLESRRPPEPPLDEMWAQIELRAFGDGAVHRTIPVWRSRWATTTLATAAALVFGVALGRYVVPSANAAPPSLAAVPATSGAASATSNSVSTPTPGPRTMASADTRGPDSARMTVASTSSEHQAPTRARALVSREPADASPASTFALVSQLDDMAGGNDVTRYLAHTAALLTALPSGHTSAASDTLIANRAGELLTQTHLMLDSQAGSDPTLHRLLEDLELVLAQVARLRAPQSRADLQLIHQALTVRDVLPRVHDAAVEASITD